MGHILYEADSACNKIYKTACGKCAGIIRGAWMRALFYIQATYGCEKNFQRMMVKVKTPSVYNNQ